MEERDVINQPTNSTPDKNSDLREFKVKNWMTPRPYTIQSGKTLREAAELLDLHQIKSLPIVDEYDHPINVVTMSRIVSCMVKGEGIDSIISNRKGRNFVSINIDDSVLDIYKLPYGSFPVVDHDEKLVGILTRRDILDCFSKYTSKLERGRILS